MAEKLDDRSSFRRFCSFSSSEPTPERTAFVHFRKALVERQLNKVLFGAVTAQHKAKAIRAKTDTLVDATIIASAGEVDDDAHWVSATTVAAVIRATPRIAWRAMTRGANDHSGTAASICFTSRP